MATYKLSIYLLVALPDSSASLPLPLLFVRGRLGVDVDEDGCDGASLSFCLAFTLALERSVLDSAVFTAAGCDVDGLLDVASDCWVMSI